MTAPAKRFKKSPSADSTTETSSSANSILGCIFGEDDKKVSSSSNSKLSAYIFGDENNDSSSVAAASGSTESCAAAAPNNSIFCQEKSFEYERAASANVAQHQTAMEAKNPKSLDRDEILLLRYQCYELHREKTDQLESLLTVDVGQFQEYSGEEQEIEELVHMAATILCQTGIVILKHNSGDDDLDKKPAARKGPEHFIVPDDSKKPAAKSNGVEKKPASSGKEDPCDGGSSLKDPELYKSEKDENHSSPTVEIDDYSIAEPGQLFSSKLMDQLSIHARQIESAVCSRIDEAHPKWRDKDAPQDFRYHEVALRGNGRIDVRYKLDEAPFTLPSVIRNPLIYPLAQALLNNDANLVYAGLIFSFPGSTNQSWHMDGKTLFPEFGDDLPPYALNVFIPLQDVTEELGPTELFAGSHLQQQASMIDDALFLSTGGQDDMLFDDHLVAPSIKRGDVLIYDYRVCHRGTENLSLDQTRPMLYLMYARGWFKEHVNFGKDRLFQ